MSYATKKEASKLKSMEKFCKKEVYDKQGNCTSKKMKLTISFDGKEITGIFYAGVLHEMLEYYNSSDY